MIEKFWLAPAFLLLGMACSNDEPGFSVDGNSAVIDLRFLGEYPTSVRRVRLHDPTTNAVLWEILSPEGNGQLWELRFSGGSNPAVPLSFNGRGYEVLVPEGDTVFSLKSGAKYVVEIWFKSTESEPDSRTSITIPLGE